MTSIPFYASSHLWDTFDLNGVLHLAPPVLVVEYEGNWIRYDDDGKESGTTEWKATRLEVPFSEIVAIQLQRRWFRSPRMLIRVRTIPALGEFPLAKGVECEIPIARKYRDDAQALVADVEAAVADLEIKRLEAGENIEH